MDVVLPFVLPLLVAVAVVAIVVAGGRGAAIDKWRHFCSSVRARPLAWVLLGASANCCFVGFFWVVNFLVADTPTEALSKWHIALPDGWEAGVMNHGEYFRWYTISGHPYLFTGALLWLGGAVSAFAYLHKRLRLDT